MGHVAESVGIKEDSPSRRRFGRRVVFRAELDEPDALLNDLPLRFGRRALCRRSACRRGGRRGGGLAGGPPGGVGLPLDLLVLVDVLELHLDARRGPSDHGWERIHTRC